MALIKFAPLNVPLERRLQTIVVFLQLNFFIAGGFVLSYILFVHLFFTRFYWISLLYLAWWTYDLGTSSAGGRRSQRARRFFSHKFVRDFFPVSLVKTAALDPRQNYLMGYHPHGLISVGAFVNFATEATNFSQIFPHIRPFLLTLKLLHRFPIYGEYLRSLGICDVSRESIRHIFKTKGNLAVIVVGGAREAIDAHPKRTSLVLKNRKGFIKMALTSGAHLLPSYTFGENDIYRQLINNGPGSYARKIQEGFLKIFGFPPLLFAGRGVLNYTFGALPFRQPVTTVVGRPIVVDREESPSQEQIDFLHGKYMAELDALFDQHKDRFGYGNYKLQFGE